MRLTLAVLAFYILQYFKIEVNVIVFILLLIYAAFQDIIETKHNLD